MSGRSVDSTETKKKLGREKRDYRERNVTDLISVVCERYFTNFRISTFMANYLDEIET